MPLLPSPLRTEIGALLREAGRTILLPAFHDHRTGGVHRKQDGSPVTETDRRCQEFLHRHLRRCTPRFAFLGEEMEPAAQQQALRADTPCWCLDPLDGTSNFVAGIPCFAISLGLLHQGRAVAGWIYDPVADELFCPDDPPQPAPTAASPLAESVGFVDFKRLTPRLALRLLTHPIGSSQRNLGSCALEWAWLTRGRGRFLIHGGEQIWDYAAGLALARNSGCMVCDFSGADPLAGGRLASSILAARSEEELRALQQAVA
ncbi:MAG: inositol monophosphatase family protein, partial [Zetaproteobacteria bacterium]